MLGELLRDTVREPGQRPSRRRSIRWALANELEQRLREQQDGERQLAEFLRTARVN